MVRDLKPYPSKGQSELTAGRKPSPQVQAYYFLDTTALSVQLQRTGTLFAVNDMHVHDVPGCLLRGLPTQRL